MNKLSLDLLENLTGKKCTSNEIQFVIYCLQRADNYGRVQGLNYRDVAQGLHITERDFYYIKDRLETKGIISVDWTNSKTWKHEKDWLNADEWVNNCDWNITINNNTMSGSDDYSKGYININRQIFTSKDFMQEKGNVKLLVMLLMRSCRDNVFKIGIKKLGTWVGVKTISTIEEYVESLRKYFRINVSNNGVLIFGMKKDKFVKNVFADEDIHIGNRVIAFCKQFRIHYTYEDLKELVKMFKQFDKSWRKLFYALYESTRKKFLVQTRLINHIMGTLKQAWD